MLFFSKYVDDHSKELRSAFVTHEGKKTLNVDIPTLFEDIENYEEQFFKPMVEQIRKNTTEGVVEKLECNFSTTQFVQRVCSTAVIMNTMKDYFEYEVTSRCGIKNIHFGGILDDWKKVKFKT